MLANVQGHDWKGAYSFIATFSNVDLQSLHSRFERP